MPSYRTVVLATLTDFVVGVVQQHLSVFFVRLICTHLLVVSCGHVVMQGEVLQMRPTEDGGGAFEYYVRKNYYKTGSLMANSCKASAVLGQHDFQVWCHVLRCQSGD